MRQNHPDASAPVRDVGFRVLGLWFLKSAFQMLQVFETVYV